jgi:hypothetical protein
MTCGIVTFLLRPKILAICHNEIAFCEIRAVSEYNFTRRIGLDKCTICRAKCRSRVPISYRKNTMVTSAKSGSRIAEL